MKTRFYFYAPLVAVAASCILAQGCKKEEDQRPAVAQAGEEAEPDVEQLLYEALDAAYVQANDLLDQAQTNEAVAVFEALLDDPRFAPQRERLFGEALRFQLYAGQADSVRARVLQACEAGDVAAARVGLQLILPHTQESEGVADAYAFAAAVAALPGIDAEVVRLTTEWRFFTALSLSDREQATDALATILKTFPAAAATSAIAQAFEQLFSSDRLDDLEALHAQVAAAAGADEERARLLQTAAVRLAAGRSDWETMARLFKAAAAELPDAALQRLMYQVFPAARKAGRLEVVDACAEEVIFKQGAKTASAAQAARFWGESAMTADRAVFPDRLNALLGAKIPARHVSGLFTRYFYDLINEAAVLKAVLPVAGKLLAEVDEDTAKMIKTMQLDGAFVLEDYDLAVSYLEAGIPDRDDAWHKMALSKVKAHRALKNKNPREAVEFFRVFMTCIDDVKDDDTVDPSTGIQHTKDMLRGRNAKRIAEILESVPDAEAAAKARAEAAAYYRKAIDAITDEDARKIILDEAGDLLKL